MTPIRQASGSRLRVAVLVASDVPERVVFGFAQSVRHQVLVAVAHSLLELEQQRVVLVVGRVLPVGDARELRILTHPRDPVRKIQIDSVTVRLAPNHDHVGCDPEVATKHPGHTDAGLVRVGIHRVIRQHGDIRRRRREELVARRAEQRIGVAGIVDDDGTGLRPRELAKVLQRAHVVVEQPVAGMHVRAPVAADVPCDAKTRANIVAVPARIGAVLKRNRDRKLREPRPELLPDAAEKVREILIERAELHVIAQPEVQGEVARKLPVILEVDREMLHRNLGERGQRVVPLRRERRPVTGVVLGVPWHRPGAEG